MSCCGLFLRRDLSRLVCLVCCLFLIGCAMHPLGMSDDEWNQLTAEQKLEARKQEAQNQRERERLRQEKQKKQEAEQLQKDIAAGMIMQYAPDSPYCMGGDRCPNGSFNELIVSLRRLAHVDRIVFYADDSPGRKHNGVVSVYADGVLVADKIDIKRHGQWHQVLVARPARTVTLRALNDDEVEIGQVKIYGSWATAGDTIYYIIKEQQ